jgi:hypothetical protein
VITVEEPNHGQEDIIKNNPEEGRNSDTVRLFVMSNLKEGAV